MDLFAALAAVGRRWYLAVVLLVLVVAGVVFAAHEAGVRYKATASEVLLPPQTVKVKGVPISLGTENPYLSIGTSGIGTFGSALVQRMASDPVKAQVVAQGGTKDFVVTQGLMGTTSTILTVTATADTSTQASKTVSIVGSLLAQNADTLQVDAKATPRSFIALQSLSAGNAPSALRGSRVRVAVAVGAVGLVLMLAIILVVDQWLTGRRRSRRRLATTGGPAGSGDDSAPDQGSAVTDG